MNRNLSYDGGFVDGQRQSPTISSPRLALQTRWEWRQSGRRIVAEHVTAVITQLKELQGSGVADVTTTPGGAVMVVLPEWTVSIAGVAACAQAALLKVAGHPCCLADAGRYGRLWWIAVSSRSPVDPGRAVILGSHLSLTSIEHGPFLSQGPSLDGRGQMPELTLEPIGLPTQIHGDRLFAARRRHLSQVA